MHEAGLAARIVGVLERQGALESGRHVRLLVHGGHGDPDAFDAALRLHLAAQRPNLADVPIVHLPQPTLCTSCGATFERLCDEACPACGGVGLPNLGEERVEVELEDNTCA